jgi:hypothetical protein
MNCPICHNHAFLSDTDSKISDCSNCGAPIRNPHYPLTKSHSKALRNRWESWGVKTWQELIALRLAMDAPMEPPMETSVGPVVGNIVGNLSETVERLSDQWLPNNELAGRLSKQLRGFSKAITASENRQNSEQILTPVEVTTVLDPVHSEDEPSLKSVSDDGSDDVQQDTEKMLIERYNQGMLAESASLTVVEQTEESLKRYIQEGNGLIQLKASYSGKYWVLPSGQTQKNMPIFYLVLRQDIQLNQHNLGTVKACFEFENRAIANGRFDLVSPAILKLAQGRQLWELVRRGVVRFQEV